MISMILNLNKWSLKSQDITERLFLKTESNQDQENIEVEKAKNTALFSNNLQLLKFVIFASHSQILSLKQLRNQSHSQNHATYHNHHHATFHNQCHALLLNLLLNLLIIIMQLSINLIIKLFIINNL